jgi:hypothetical protein
MMAIAVRQATDARQGLSYAGREEELKREAAAMTKFAELLQAQTEQVQKGAYKTRKEALGALEHAMKEALKGLK